ncbi:hypothetical protein CRG98_014982 [Punica granatum]|uniref:PB1-like domain-containing protein n=1 Tax=Punica granatum TaxID=22663 RepID=A0A2I0K8N5_PUNGR|nr:hypothetical protein CRG98_014982 [Punica granatum]
MSKGTQFGLILHHGGLMQFKPHVRYLGGVTTVIANEKDNMSWFHLKRMLDEFGYKEPRRMWHLLLEKYLGIGLRDMNTDTEVWEMTELEIKHEMIAVYVEADKKDYDEDATNVIDVVHDSVVAVDGSEAINGGVAGERGIVVDNEDDTEYYPPKEEDSDAYSNADDEYNSDNDNEEFLDGHILRITQGNRQSEMQVDEERVISH